MNILLVGNGGREHALAWKIRQSKACADLFVAPGNSGTATIAHNVLIASDDFEKLGTFCLENAIDLVVVGPEGPLVAGIRDYFEAIPALRNILLVGPGKTGAQLEGSKDFSKQFMNRHFVPTAKARTFQAAELAEGIRYLRSCRAPIVLKADGLAAGKGVVISPSHDEAAQELTEMLQGKFGDASAKVLIEEFLDGVELSVFVLTDGTDYVVLPEAKDYKRIGENDGGPNTGGMGAVSPVAFADQEFIKKVEERVIRPTISGLKKEGIPYRGFIFFGLIKVGNDPYVIEYNARMGDPETQAVMPRIKSDLVGLLVATAKGELKGKGMVVDSDYSVTVALVSGGYPGPFVRGKPISGLPLGLPMDETGDALVFHAGAKILDGQTVTDGGRVLAVTGRGPTLEEAREKAYRAISDIHWDGLYFRKDIGLDLKKLIK